MDTFSFCPICGSRLVEKHLPTEMRPRLVCEACGHILYLNPKIVGGTLPIEDGKVWLLRRGIEPRLGFWTHPAGYQEIDESTEEAARRETIEEIGLNVAITRLLGVYSRPGGHVVNIVYLARPTDDASRPTLTEEATEIGLFGPDEIPWHDLAFPSTASALQDWLEGR
jgi:ADP-ribose pyrophosphatase YjhB (NUDIX family)